MEQVLAGRCDKIGRGCCCERIGAAALEFVQKVGSADDVESVGEGGLDDWNSCERGRVLFLLLALFASSLDSSVKSTAEGSQDLLCGLLLVAIVCVTTAGESEGLDGADLSGVTILYL